MAKAKIATTSMCGCFGCHMSLLDIDERILQLVELVEFDELIERSDFITVHVPKTDKTTNLIGAEQFKRMKPTCRVINCARGGMVNEQELAQALRDKVIAGAGLDVYTSEPFKDNPFIGLDNIVMSPHLAASTDEAQLTVAVDVAKQIGL